MTAPLRQRPGAKVLSPDAGKPERRGAAFWAIAIGVAASLVASALLLLWSMSAARTDFANDQSLAASARDADSTASSRYDFGAPVRRSKTPRRHDAARKIEQARSERLYAEYEEQERFAAANAARVIHYERQRRDEDREAAAVARRYWLASPGVDGAIRVELRPMAGQRTDAPTIEYVRRDGGEE